MLWTSTCWDQTVSWVSTVIRGSAEVSMGDGGRDGIPRECCGGGEGELNIFNAREKKKSQKPRGEKKQRAGGKEAENSCQKGINDMRH